MFHFEGGWPKEINPKDEETTARFRRRVEKDDEWASKLRNLFKVNYRLYGECLFLSVEIF